MKLQKIAVHHSTRCKWSSRSKITPGIVILFAKKVEEFFSYSLISLLHKIAAFQQNAQGAIAAALLDSCFVPFEKIMVEHGDKCMLKCIII